MPQFTTSTNMATEYWKGVDHYHKKRRSSMRSFSMNHIHLRQDIGLVVYEKCPRRELVSFARSKKLDIRGKVSSETLVELLYADEGFSRFLDLPAELRSIIYQEYFSFRPHADSDILRVSPPITAVNRQLRSEAMPEFWGKEKFSLFARGYSNYYLKQSVPFFQMAPAEHLAMIRKLVVKKTPSLEWELDLATPYKPAAVRRLRGGRVWSKVDKQLLKLLHAISNRLDSPCLQRTDLKELQKIWQNIRWS